jgi:hypothetical protein
MRSLTICKLLKTGGFFPAKSRLFSVDSEVCLFASFNNGSVPHARGEARIKKAHRP